MKSKNIKNLARIIKPSRFADYKVFMEHLYKKNKTEAASYSYLQFSQDLGLGYCNTSFLLIKGKRAMTVKTGRKIADAIGLTGPERKFWIALINYQTAKSESLREKYYTRLVETRSDCVDNALEKKYLQFFSAWYHTAIFELLAFEEASDDPKWLSQNLIPRVPEKKVVNSLKLLESLELIAFDEALGRLTPVEDTIQTASELRSLVIKTYHREMIHLGLDALIAMPAKERDISSVTISIEKSKINEIKKLTREYRKALMDLAAPGTAKDQVYQVNIQAFPLAREVKKND